jgi:hypothetical protein
MELSHVDEQNSLTCKKAVVDTLWTIGCGIVASGSLPG